MYLFISVLKKYLVENTFDGCFYIYWCNNVIATTFIWSVKLLIKSEFEQYYIHQCLNPHCKLLSQYFCGDLNILTSEILW